jgi:hypothetical protein
MIGDKEYYGEDNPTLVRDVLYVFGAYLQVVCMNQYEGPVGDTQNK